MLGRFWLMGVVLWIRVGLMALRGFESVVGVGRLPWWWMSLLFQKMMVVFLV